MADAAAVGAEAPSVAAHTDPAVPVDDAAAEDGEGPAPAPAAAASKPAPGDNQHYFYKAIKHMNDGETFKACAQLQEASICKFVNSAEKLRAFNQESERELPVMREHFDRHAAMLAALCQDLMTIDTTLQDIRMRLVSFGASRPAEREGD